MKASWTVMGAAAAMMLGSQVASADTVIWGGGTGDFNQPGNWVDGVAPVEGDEIIINAGTAQNWFGGLANVIRNDTTITINGGEIDFPNQSHWVSVGTGGTGTASALTINAGGTYDMNGGQFAVGNDAGEIGNVTVAAGGTLASGNAFIDLEDTGTINSSGTVTGFGSLNLLGGIVNVLDGSFSVASVNFESNEAQGQTLNISGGTVNVGSVSALQLGFGNRYFNFTTGSTGLLTLANVDTATLSSYLNSGYVRLDGVTDASAFTVSAFGDNGSQIALVPEPSALVLMGLGVGLMARRGRRSAV